MEEMKEKGMGKIGILLVIVIIITIVGTGFTLVFAEKETLKISGSTTVRPLARKWRNEFMKENPNIRISVKGGGSGQGVSDVKGGLSNIGMSSSKTLVTKENDLVLHLMAYDAILLIVNEKNPILNILKENGIKQSTLQKIYSGKTTNWKDIPGIERNQTLFNYRRSDKSGTGEVFAGFLRMTQGELEGIGVHGNLGIKEAIISNKWGIGFVGAKYAFDNSIEVIPLDGNNDGEITDYERIENFNDLTSDIENYPIQRGLYFATKGEPTGMTGTFMEWCKNEGQSYISEIGYVPITGSR
ncbi:hypothetical protein AKJ36_01680 [candidate division MSBL1 archaeon SCGC-AAA259I07]|uniref:PBP domain-containing protein n=1 Tax=candidate division MSBL1 archaeon SCGC-AAA259I07 TaxID=1698266 RepID=A0A133ULP7_9EURY|nr:hypothetical protein AKJ36_01680 [candidate division MSBL1 archaeon SCGC-AAA259I07]